MSRVLSGCIVRAAIQQEEQTLLSARLAEHAAIRKEEHERRIRSAVLAAERDGVIVTVERRPFFPPAMGNDYAFVEARTRERKDDAKIS